MTFGLPTGTRISYGATGFPAWVYQLADHFGLKASTYPGHQENHRAEQGFAPNPRNLNRGIDWAGPIPNMQRFADYLMTVRSSLEQVIWQHPATGHRTGVAGGRDVTQSSYYASDYAGHRDHVHTRQSAPIPLPGGVVSDNRPDFNEFALWSKNNSARSGKPTMFLLHTQEGGGGDAAAENLAKWFQNGNGVSYHYTVSQASDGGTTVVDCVDTDRAAWSVGNANSISINLCFAGSRAAWTREQWLKQRGAIEAAAYLAVQDAKKYGFSTLVVPPPYSAGRPGISDHRWVTDVYKWGTHTDIGPNFPWDVFAAAVDKYSGKQAPPVPPKPGPKQFPKDYTDRQLLEYIAEQLGPGLDTWGEDGDLGHNADGKRRTFRAGVAAIMRKLGA